MENWAEPIPLVRVFATRLQGPREGFSRSDTLYALPILNAQGKPRPLPQVALAIQRFLAVTRNRRDRQFLIPSLGVAPGEGGYAREQIAPLFASAPANCRFVEAEYAAAIPRPKACYRVVIAGSRSLKDYAPVAAVLDTMARHGLPRQALWNDGLGFTRSLHVRIAPRVQLLAHVRAASSEHACHRTRHSCPSLCYTPRS